MRNLGLPGLSCHHGAEYLRGSSFWTYRPLMRLSTRSTMNAGVSCMDEALSVRPAQPWPPSR